MEINPMEEDFDKLLEDKRHKELLEAIADKSNTDLEFQRLLEDKRHKEITYVLKEILLSLSKKEPNDLSSIESILKEISKRDNQDLPKSILAMGKIISDKLDSIKVKEPDYKWEFIIHRDYKELITKIDANKIIIK